MTRGTWIFWRTWAVIPQVFISIRSHLLKQTLSCCVHASCLGFCNVAALFCIFAKIWSVAKAEKMTRLERWSMFNLCASPSAFLWEPEKLTQGRHPEIHHVRFGVGAFLHGPVLLNMQLHSGSNSHFSCQLCLCSFHCCFSSVNACETLRKNKV